MTLDIWNPRIFMAMIARIPAYVLSMMVKPVGAPRVSWHTLRWISTPKACLIIAMLIMAWGPVLQSHAAPEANADLAPQNLVPGSPLSFDDSVRVAIHQSPYFTKTSTDIDIRRMDETDSRYGLVPPLTFRTYYYINRPSGTGTGPPYSLSFSTDPYNPLRAYFTLQAQKLATQAAVLAHLSIISNGLESLGKIYLQLDSLHKLAGYQRDLVKLAQDNLTYVKNRLTIGTATSLEVKVAQQELQLAQGEQEGLALTIKRTLYNLKNFLGLPTNQEFTPNFQDARRQVLGSFDPTAVTLEQAKSRSYDLKTLEIYKNLQDYNVSLAIAKVFPTFLFTTQTPDPLSVTTGRGLYVGIGIDVPVWDGFTRFRNISRQKAVLKQTGAKKDQKEGMLEDKWFDVLGDIHDKNVALKNAQALEELARLKARQQEVRYQSGEEPLPVFLASRKEVLKAQKDTILRALDYDKAVLTLREVSGDLGNTYVDAISWQK